MPDALLEYTALSSSNEYGSTMLLLAMLNTSRILPSYWVAQSVELVGL